MYTIVDSYLTTQKIILCVDDLLSKNAYVGRFRIDFECMKFG